LGKDRIDRLSVGHKSGMGQDGGLDLTGCHPKLAVPWTGVVLKQIVLECGKDVPIAGQVVYIVVGDAASQMGGDVLQVFGFGAINVAGDD